MTENKFFRMVDVSTGKVKSELIIQNYEASKMFETISRGEYPSIIPFLKNPSIVMKFYSYNNIWDFAEKKEAEFTKKDKRYDSLNKRLSEAGL